MKTRKSSKLRPSLALLAGAFLVAGAFLLVTGPAAIAGIAGTTDGANICPPKDRPACVTQCLLHKRECWKGCRSRKRQCLEEARAEALACKLECRAADGSVEEPGVCRRRCMAAAIAKAKKECKLGFPVCYRECNPRSCREECGLDTPVAARPDVASCRPPVDRECLGQCARDLRLCARRVYNDGKQCVAGCRELKGAERRMCVRDCVDKTVAAGKQCLLNFRECVGGCKATTDPTTPAPIG